MRRNINKAKYNILIKIDSYKRGAIVSTILNVLAKVIAFLNTIIITYYFGTQAETDIYFYLISVAALVCTAINSIDLLVLVPETLRLKNQENPKKARQFINFFLYLYCFLGLVMGIIILISPIGFYTFFSKFDTATIEKFVFILELGIGVIFFQLVNGLLASVLTCYKFFIAPIVAGLINSLLTITFTFFLHDSLGIKGALLGILFGYVVNFILLVTTMYSKLQWNFFDVTIMKDKLVWKNIGLIQMNILPIWIRNYLTITLLSSMAAGTITALNIAQNIAMIPEVFITSQIIAITGIKFSELNSLNAFEALKKLLDNVLMGLLLIIVPISIVFAICADDIVSILYLRGNFDAKSLNLTSFCLLYLSILMPFKIPDSLFTRLFTSLQVYQSMVFFGLAAHTFIAASIYLFTIQFGLLGYFLALLFGYCIIMPITFFLILHFKTPTLKSSILLKNLLYIIVISLVISTVTGYAYAYIHSTPIINLIITSLLVSVSFWISSYFLLDIQSLKSYLNQFTSKLKAIKQ